MSDINRSVTLCPTGLTHTTLFHKISCSKVLFQTFSRTPPHPPPHLRTGNLLRSQKYQSLDPIFFLAPFGRSCSIFLSFFALYNGHFLVNQFHYSGTQISEISEFETYFFLAPFGRSCIICLIVFALHNNHSLCDQLLNIVFPTRIVRLSIDIPATYNAKISRTRRSVHWIVSQK